MTCKPRSFGRNEGTEIRRDKGKAAQRKLSRETAFALALLLFEKHLTRRYCLYAILRRCLARFERAFSIEATGHRVWRAVTRLADLDKSQRPFVDPRLPWIASSRSFPSFCRKSRTDSGSTRHDRIVKIPPRLWMNIHSDETELGRVYPRAVFVSDKWIAGGRMVMSEESNAVLD